MIVIHYYWSKMSQKNKLKKRINNCFFCGKELNEKSEKVSHRLDLKKGLRPSNVIILCPTCKYFFNTAEKKIFNFLFDFDCIDKYFKNFDIEYKKLIKYRIIKLRKEFERKCQE